MPERPYRPVLEEGTALADTACDEPYSATSDIFCGVLNQHCPTRSVDILKEPRATVASTHPTVELDRFSVSRAAITGGVSAIIDDDGLSMATAP